MAIKKVEIQFDFNTNDVKLASNATLTLAQQIRILKQELQKTQEGTKEFEILKNKLNETKDNFERVNTKSRELFGTLSLIPGPIGDIAGKLNGAVSLLKVFSGFSLKDVAGQFKALGQDIGNIVKNLGSWGEATKEIDSVQNDLNQTLSNSNNINATAGAQIAQNTQKESENISQLQKKIQIEKDYQEQLKLEINLLDEEILQNGKNSKEGKKATEQRKIYNDELKTSQTYSERFNSELATLTNTTKTNTSATQQNAVAETERAVATDVSTKNTVVNTVATKAFTIATNAATTAVRILKAVLVSLGIGLIVVAISELVSRLYSWASGNEEVEKTQKALNAELSKTNELADLQSNALKRNNAERLANMKAAGATEAQIRAEQLRQAKALYSKAYQDEVDARKLYNKGLGQADEATLKTLDDNLTKRIEQTRDAASQVRIIEAENIEAAKKDREEAQKDREQKQKEADQKRLAQLDAQIQLEINKAETDGKELTKLLQERLDLENKIEKKSNEENQLIRDENSKKVKDELIKDFEERRKTKLSEYQTLVEIEKNREEVDTERLIKVLEKQRDIELEETKNGIKLNYDERQAITLKYEKQFRELRQQEREKQLVEDIQANKGNFDKQIELYQQFADEVLKSENYTAGEKLKIINDANQKIIQLNQERYQNELNELQLKFGSDYKYNEDYYNQLNALYDEEEARYKKLFEEKKITEAEYTEFLKKNKDSRVQLQLDELKARTETFQAIGDIFTASASLAGEQTRAGKALAIAGATINTYAAANQVLADPLTPAYLKALKAAAIIINGLANVRRITATPIPSVSNRSDAQFGPAVVNVTRKAQGGVVYGPGGQTSDNVPALLSDGEYVVNARSSRVFRPLLETINSAQNLPAFAVGGLVGGSSTTGMKSQNETLSEAISNAFGQTPIRTYVTATEVSTQQQFDRIIKSRSLI